MYTIGQRVMISSGVKNENYDSFRDKVLVVVHAEVGGLLYEECMYPQQLMYFETEEGEEFPFSLYEYEVIPLAD